MVLVFGRTGQLAREIARAAPGAVCLDRSVADLTDPGTPARVIAAHAPDAVINAAAWTDVDGAEDEEALAATINADAPGVMARECAARGIPLVHVSTDYVFDGAGTRPWAPEDAPAPLNAYGRGKLAGERAVAAACGSHAILRTAWVVSAHGRNFVTTMQRLGAERDRLRVVADQIGGPTPAADLARACLNVAGALRADPALTGTYHYAGAPEVSWADFARAIMTRAGLTCRVEDISTAEWPTPAARPLNSRLDCSATEAAFGLPRPDWRVGLEDILSELGARAS